jgi:hypothetical protein
VIPNVIQKEEAMSSMHEVSEDGREAYERWTDEIAAEAKRLRVPMSHLPGDPEYRSVLEYRVGQEIAAAKKRLVALEALSRKVGRSL